ncbi:MAG: methyltransferase domain-containing protein [Spirochaetes bacterium]|nr:methyltransferase domain-containing protein [Spirochaetota bacterium]
MKKVEKEFYTLLKNEGIRENIIDAFKNYKQKDFFDQIFSGYFYSHEPVPIGNGEKGDASPILAKMINHLSPDKESRILEIGTGSGYSTAILSKLFKEIVTVEYFEELAISAKQRLAGFKINNVRFLTGDILELDGIPGLFDGIIIFAACSVRPLFLMTHLKEKGKVIFPMGPIYQQQITIMKNEQGEKDSQYKMSFHDLCSYSPLKGMY